MKGNYKNGVTQVLTVSDYAKLKRRVNPELYQEIWRRAAEKNYKKNYPKVIEQHKSYRHRNPDKIRERNQRRFGDDVPSIYRPTIDNILDQEAYKLESTANCKRDYSLVSLLSQYTTFQKNSEFLNNYLDNYELPQEQKVDEMHRVLQAKILSKDREIILLRKMLNSALNELDSAHEFSSYELNRMG